MLNCDTRAECCILPWFKPNTTAAAAAAAIAGDDDDDDDASRFDVIAAHPQHLLLSDVRSCS